MYDQQITSTFSLVTLSALSFASAACTHAAAVREPGLEARAFEIRAVHGEADAPARTCRITEPSRPLASRVFVPYGVDVRTEGDRFAIRYAERKSSCRALEATSSTGTFAPVDGSSACPDRSVEAAAFGDVATMFAEESYDDSDVPHIVLGLVSYEPAGAPRWAALSGRTHITRRRFQPPAGGPSGGERSPNLVSLGDDKFLLVWVEGDSENREVRAQPVTAAGAAVGPAFDVSPRDAAVIGRPSAAVGADGQGVIAFVAARDNGFAVMSTAIACDSGEATQAHAHAAIGDRMARR